MIGKKVCKMLSAVRNITLFKSIIKSTQRVNKWLWRESQKGKRKPVGKGRSVSRKGKPQPLAFEDARNVQLQMLARFRPCCS